MHASVLTERTGTGSWSSCARCSATTRRGTAMARTGSLARAMRCRGQSRSAAARAVQSWMCCPQQRLRRGCKPCSTVSCACAAQCPPGQSPLDLAALSHSTGFVWEQWWRTHPACYFRVLGTMQCSCCGQPGWACQQPSPMPMKCSASCVDCACLHSITTTSRPGSGRTPKYGQHEHVRVSRAHARPRLCGSCLYFNGGCR